MYQQHDLRSKLFNIYQNLDYEYFTTRNSSEYIHNIQTLTAQFTNNIVISGLKGISELFVTFIIISFLLFVNTQLFIVLLVLMLIFILLYDRAFKKKLSGYGQLSNECSDNMIRCLNETVLGFKELRILKCLDFFKSKMLMYSQKYGKAYAVGIIAGNIPRYLFELILFLFLIVCVVYSVMLGDSVSKLLPDLAVFCIAAVRLVPAGNVLSRSLVQLRFSNDCVSRLYQDLNVKIYSQNDAKNKDFSHQFTFLSLELRNLTFKYKKSSSPTLKNVNLMIKKGVSIGIIGKSGSGKSTLVDLMLGLLKPTEGSIYLNQQKAGVDYLLNDIVGYLPQNLFLSDDTIKNNIALGKNSDEIDLNKIDMCLRKSNLHDYVESLENGVESIVGQNGINLSGGQRQRIVLARAFYFDKPVLILDESTSALDESTENLIINELLNSNTTTTIIIISHRLSAISDCDFVYEVENNTVELMQLKS